MGERKKGGSDDAPQISGEIYRHIIENTSDYIVLVDMRGRYIYVSPSHKKLGYEPAELLGKSGLDMVHPEDRKRLLPILASVTKNLAKLGLNALLGNKKETIPKSIGFRFPDKSGSWRNIESTPDIVKNPSGIGYAILLVSKDVTERKKSEEEMKKLNQELKSKVEELERFTKLAVGRELQMIELKKRIAELEGKK